MSGLRRFRPRLILALTADCLFSEEVIGRGLAATTAGGGDWCVTPHRVVLT